MHHSSIYILGTSKQLRHQLYFSFLFILGQKGGEESGTTWEDGVFDISLNFLANPKSHSCQEKIELQRHLIGQMHSSCCGKVKTKDHHTFVIPFSSNRMFDGFKSQ